LKPGWNLSNLSHKYQPLASDKVSFENPYFNRLHIALQLLAFIIAICDHGLRRATATSHEFAHPRYICIIRAGE
jgi:hypothetical protein